MTRLGFVFLSLTFWFSAAGAAPVIYEFRGVCPDWKPSDYRWCTDGVTGTVTLNPSYVPGQTVKEEDLAHLETSHFGGPAARDEVAVWRVSGRLPTSRDWAPATVYLEINRIVFDWFNGFDVNDRVWIIATNAETGFWDVEYHTFGGFVFEQGAQAEWRLVSNTPVTVPLPATGALLGGVVLGGAFVARLRARRRQGGADDAGRLYPVLSDDMGGRGGCGPCHL